MDMGIELHHIGRIGYCVQYSACVIERIVTRGKHIALEVDRRQPVESRY